MNEPVKSSLLALLSRVMFGLFLLAGCGAGVLQPTLADVTRASERWPGTTLADLEAGRALYVRRCGTCHTLYEPSYFPGEPEWRDNLAQMRERAKVRPDQEELILKYLVAVGSRR